MAEDTPPGFTPLSSLNVAVVGLGLMGGSLAMDLHGRCHTLIGIDNDPAVLELAGQKGFADRLGLPSTGLLSSADVIILAIPVNSILEFLAHLPGFHPGSALVIDLGSTKRDILRCMDGLPERFDPLGGHPMCGKEHNSLLHAQPGLFSGAAFALCPLPRTSARARAIASQVVSALDAREVWMDAETHDRCVAATSHVPFLAANTLAVVTPLAAAPMAGPGFKSTTRVGETDPALMVEVMRSNRDNVLRSLADYRTRLELLEALLLREDWVEMERLFQLGCKNRQEILEAAERITI